jgi:hypothetical protein
LGGGGEEKSVFTDIHTPIVASPLIDLAKPGTVTITENRGRKPVRLTVGSNQYVHRLLKGSGLYFVHDVLRRDPEEILEHQPIRARLKLRLRQVGHIVAIIGGHANLIGRV